MDERINYVISEIQKVGEDAQNTFADLSASQLNWKPAEGSWSVGQCLDHLIRTNSSFDGTFEEIASGSRKNSFWENWSPMTGIGGRFLINFIKNDSKKVKAPSRSIVPPSDIEPDIVERFVTHTAEIIGKIKAIKNADPRKTVITSPFMRFMTYTLDDGYTIMVEHNKRHLRQAKRVAAADGFPKV
jgi:hypothetical protein